ncbi:MAG TPA: 50S ribosomal protein L15 [Opitutales bacterium]|nr:50S ribosomal protein L15 [Opitutales bacterium]
MRLHTLVQSEGATHPTKRLGRGRSSGHGKTSSRGGKGQTARSGAHQRPGFESGHVPFYRKIPKHGFNQTRYQVEWSVINVDAIDTLPEGVTDVNLQVLEECGLVHPGNDLLKILGTGEITRAFNISAQKFSASAKEKIEKAGGKAIVLADTTVKPEADKA